MCLLAWNTNTKDGIYLFRTQFNFLLQTNWMTIRLLIKMTLSVINWTIIGKLISDPIDENRCNYSISMLENWSPQSPSSIWMMQTLADPTYPCFNSGPTLVLEARLSNDLVDSLHTDDIENTESIQPTKKNTKSKGLIGKNANKGTQISNKDTLTESQNPISSYLFVNGEFVLKSPVELHRLPRPTVEAAAATVDWEGVCRGEGEGAGDTELLLCVSECKDPFDWWWLVRDRFVILLRAPLEPIVFLRSMASILFPLAPLGLELELIGRDWGFRRRITSLPLYVLLRLLLL